MAPLDPSGATVLLPEAPESGCAYREQFERARAARVVPPGKMGFQNAEAIKRCVVAGKGVSVLPSVAVSAEFAGGKLAVPRWEEPFEILTQMAWHEERRLSPAPRAFPETAREVPSSAPVRVP